MPRGGMAARGPPVGVLRSAAHRRAESRFWGVFIIAVHRAFVLGLGARHRGIVELSEGVIRCVTVFACYSSSLFFRFWEACLRKKNFGAFSSSPYTVPLCWVWGPGIAVLWSCQRV